MNPWRRSECVATLLFLVGVAMAFITFSQPTKDFFAASLTATTLIASIALFKYADSPKHSNVT